MAESGRRSSSLQVKFTWLLAIFGGLLLLAVILLLEQNFRRSLIRENIDKGLGVARGIGFNAEDPLLTGDDLYLFSAVKNARRSPGVIYALIVDPRGTIRAADDMNRVGQTYHAPEDAEPVRSSKSFRVTRTILGQESLLDLMVPVYSVADPPIHLADIHLGLSEAQVSSDIRALRLKLLSTGLVALAIGALLAYLLAGISLRPVLALVKGVKAIGQGNLDQHIDLSRHDEIGVLTDAFNDMAASLREKEYIKSTFERYVSKQLAQVILKHRDDIQLGGEEKEVTILFSDIRRFTSLAESLPPAQVLELLNSYFSTMLEVVIQNEGMVDKLMGDSVMALFGAPISLGNDSLRAVQCALDMQRAVVGFNQRQAERGLPKLEMGIGINTGPVVAGNIGSSMRMEYTVIGDNVNVAARLQGIAGPGEILISEATYRQVAQLVEATAMDPIQLKGKTRAVEVYRIDGLKLDGDGFLDQLKIGTGH